MNPDSLLPFNWEIIWLSLGALLGYYHPETAAVLIAVLAFGGLAGGIARNYDPDGEHGPER